VFYEVLLWDSATDLAREVVGTNEGGEKVMEGIHMKAKDGILMPIDILSTS